MSLILANIIAVFHGTFVLFLIVGVVLALFGQLKKYRKIEAILLVGIVITIISFLVTGECFITTWEIQLREAAGQSYGEGFIATYLGKIGIHISGKVSFWFLTILITIGLLSELYWNKKEIWNFLSGGRFKD